MRPASEMSDARAFEIFFSNACAAYWAGEEHQRRSTSGYVFGFAGADGRDMFPVSWRSGVQSCIALSSAEAEYVALSDATKEVMYLRDLLESLNIRLDSPTALYCDFNCDSRSAIHMSAETGLSRRTRHIAVRYHLVRAAVADSLIELRWIPTTAMVADYLTKPTTRVVFGRCMDVIMNCNS